MRPFGIEFRHLRYFIAASDCGSFRKAGVALGVRESAISRRIRDLEDHLGASLFQRSHGGVRLTIAGGRYEKRARLILAQMREGMIDISAIGSGRNGRIRIGLIASVANGLPADLPHEFGTLHDSVHIDLFDGHPDAHIAALLRFDLDIAFLAETRSWLGCEAARLWSERVIVHLPGWHPLADRAELIWADLAGETIIMSEVAGGRDLGKLATTRLRDIGHIPLIQQQNVACENLLHLVTLGRGILLTIGIVVNGSCSGIVRCPIKNEMIPFAGVWSPKK